MTFPVAARRVRPVRALSILAESDRVVLVAGEDLRYALSGPRIETWLPDLLGRLDGSRTAGEAVAGMAEELRDPALGVVRDLWSERVLVEASAAEVLRTGSLEIAPEGTGPLVALLKDSGASGAAVDRTGGSGVLRVLCQDRLDFEALDRFARGCRESGAPSLWVTTGPEVRAFVSPVCLPDSGPCPACLAGHFRRRSPAPELYDLLRRHVREGREVVAGSFPEAGLQVLEGLVRLKASHSGSPDPIEACFLLHVLDLARLEVTAHPVPAEPDCPVCGGR